MRERRWGSGIVALLDPMDRISILRGGLAMSALVWVLLAVTYVVLLFWLGLSTLRNGHGLLFFLGIFFSLLWIFGAFARPAPAPQ